MLQCNLRDQRFQYCVNSIDMLILQTIKNSYINLKFRA